MVLLYLASFPYFVFFSIVNVTRGYYIRAKAIEYMITGFLKECASLASAAQIISLGAGFDTLYFRFKDLLAQFNCNVFEVFSVYIIIMYDI